jgi:putative DNA primase/helicase
LFIAGNHKPVIRGDDNGIWRRIQLIPFEVTIPAEARDVRLAEKLRGELPGILNWALEGCRSWQTREHLDPPPAVLAAVAEYKEEMDIIGQWVTDCCDTGGDKTIGSSDAYFSYTLWANTNGHGRWSHKSFSGKLKERYAHERKTAGVVFMGLGAKGAGSDPSARRPSM